MGLGESQRLRCVQCVESAIVKNGGVVKKLRHFVNKKS